MSSSLASVVGRRDYNQPATVATINSLNHYSKERHAAAQTEDGRLADKEDSEGVQLLVQSGPLPQTARRVNTKQPTPC